MANKNGYTLYGAQGSGSVAVEAALELLHIPHKVIEGATWSDEEARTRIAKVNPLKQVPCLVLPSGEVMTESAAILIWLADKHPEAKLCPPAGSTERAAYLRWMVYIPASIYSMYWVRDDPSRLAHNEDSEAVIKHRTAERIAECWKLMDSQVNPQRYILGNKLSVLDIYVSVVSRWTPRRKRFYQEAPKLAEVVKRVDAEPRLKEFWARRFPFEGNWE
jgi:GST-like protein